MPLLSPSKKAPPEMLTELVPWVVNVPESLRKLLVVPPTVNVPVTVTAPIPARAALFSVTLVKVTAVLRTSVPPLVVNVGAVTELLRVAVPLLIVIVLTFTVPLTVIVLPPKVSVPELPVMLAAELSVRVPPRKCLEIAGRWRPARILETRPNPEVELRRIAKNSFRLRLP